MKGCRWKNIVAIILFFVFNILLFNFGSRKQDFVDIKLMSILGLDATIIVSVYIVQHLIDNRRRNEYMVRLLDNVANEIANQELFSHEKTAQNTAKRKQTTIANRLMHMKDVAPAKVKKDMSYVYNTFEDARIYYDDHLNATPEDKYYERIRDNILVKIEKVQLNLFDFNVSDCKTNKS